MTNKNLVYGGAAAAVGAGVLYFLYSNFRNSDSEKTNNNPRTSSDDEANAAYEKWTGSLPKDMNWGGGKSKKNKKSKNKKSKNKKSKKNK